MSESWEVEMARELNARLAASKWPWLSIDPRNVRDLILGLADEKSISYRAKLVRYSDRLQSGEGE